MIGASSLFPVPNCASGGRLIVVAAAWLGIVAPVAAATFHWNTGNGTWDGTAGNWDPAGPPAASDNALLGNLAVAADAEVTLGLDTPALFALDITNGADLLMNGFDGEALSVEVREANSRLVVPNGSFFNNNDAETDVYDGGLLLIEDGGSYDTGELTLSDGGDAQLTGGFVEIGSSAGTGFLRIENGSELRGWGTVFFGDPNLFNSDLLINNGTIRTSRPFPDLGNRQVLTLDTDLDQTDLMLNLDGTSESGAVSLAHTTTLTILGTLTDGFSSTIDLRPGSILNISQPWTIDSGAVIDVDAVPAVPTIMARFARIEGGELTVESGATINVNSGTLEVDAEFTVLGGSVVVMDNSTLELNANTIFLTSNALDLTALDTTLVVNGTTSMRGLFSTFDWDGNGGSTTEVNEDALLEINVGSIDAGVNPYDFDGTLNISSGTVDVRVNDDDATPWVMDGTLNLANTNGTAPEITGNPLEIGNGAGGFDADVTVSGTGTSRIDTEVTVRSDGSVEVAANAVLDLADGVVLDGGALVLDGGEVTGGLISIDGGVIAGNGRVTSTSINNFGTINAAGGTLVIDTVNASQLDGAAPNNGQGILRASTGNLEVASNVTTVFNGLLDVRSGRTFTMSQPGSRFRNAPASEDDDGSGDFGRIELSGGTIVVTNFEQASELTATGSTRSTIEAENITFESGSLTEIIGGTNTLRAQGNTVIEAGATFTGSGLLENDDDLPFTLADGAHVGVRLVNNGNLMIGNSVGTATVERFVQNRGTWIVEIGGTVPSTEFDQLIVDDDADLGGTLEVELVDLGSGLFAPSMGDTFPILVADSLRDDFSEMSLPALAAGLFWQVITQPDTLLLAVADHIAGDYNRNGEVDAADYVLWRNTEGSTTELAADGNLDGTVDDLDYAVWSANFGNTASSGGSGASVQANGSVAVPEPTPAVLVIAAVLSAHGPHRRGRRRIE